MTREQDRLAELDAVRRRAAGSRRITKREWYALGGFANSRLWRRQTRTRWSYFERID
jgi:hypothetical protein